MKKLLLTLAFLFIPGVAWAQCTGVFPANTVCGNITGTAAVPSAQPTSSFISGVTGPSSAFVGDLATWSNTGGTNLADSFPGVFNPRLKFGAVADNSTDNSAAFTSIFALSNAYTNGIPTVYFDCGPNTATCVYKYSGATSSGSISPINPTVATTILCAPGVTLNYTGTAHAADIGSGVNNVSQMKAYSVKGCTWTGGTSQTEGVVFKSLVTNPLVEGNTFLNFGSSIPTSQSGAALYFADSNFQPVITNNRWIDTDGVPRNALDSHNSPNSVLYFAQNSIDCQNNSIGISCQTSPAGFGLWVVSGKIMNNSILFHYPNLRYGSSHNGVGLNVIGNHFEGNNLVSPLITFGDPGLAAATVVNVDISHNTFFALSASAGVPFIGAETTSPGSFTLGASNFDSNIFLSNPGAGATYLQTNFGTNNKIGLNIAFGSNVPLTPAAFCDTFCANHSFSLLSVSNFNIFDFPSSMVAFDPTGAVAIDASFNNITQPMMCTNTTAGNSQACQTNPRFLAQGGSTITPSAASMILFRSTQTNTGDTSLNVNSTGFVGVRKNNGAQALNAGDITANAWYLLTYDGTFWEMQNPTRTSTFGPLTFLQLPPASGFGGMTTYVSDGRAGGCADGTCTTWGTAVTSGGGSLPLLVWSNGTSWTLVGK